MKNAAAEVRVGMQAAHPRQISTERASIYHQAGRQRVLSVCRRFSNPREGFATEPPLQPRAVRAL